MIVVDGRRSSLVISNFANLEEILVTLMEEEIFAGRIVTDVLVNDEAFSEIYPHQAEDIGAEEIRSVEVRTVSVDRMAGDVVEELRKVLGIMDIGGRQVAELFRRADVAEALEVMQDLLDVTRNFLITITAVRGCLQYEGSRDIDEAFNILNPLLDEMNEVTGYQDWTLLADLIEYEFLPVCSEWSALLRGMEQNAAALQAA